MSSTMDLPSYLTTLQPKTLPQLLLYLLAAHTLYTTLTTLYTAFLGPLSKYPGPRLRALSIIPKAWAIYTGAEASAYVTLHAHYGPIVRVAPDELSYIGNPRVFRDMYGWAKSADAPMPYKDPLFMGKPLKGIHTLLSLPDAEHARQRRILSYAFSDHAIKDLEPMLMQWVETMLGKLREVCGTGRRADMLMYYNCTTFDVMADLCFNEPLHMLSNTTYSPWVRAIFAGLREITPFRAAKWVGGAPIRWLVDDVLLQIPSIRARSIEHFDYSARRVDKRLAMQSEPERADLWTKILARGGGKVASDSGKEDGSKGSEERLTLDQHHAAGMLFMGAGTETSATALAGTTYFLLKNPRCMERLKRDLRASFKPGEQMTLDGLARCEYLKAVIQEGLRMYPPVPIALARRIPDVGGVIDGEALPPGTAVGVAHLATYRYKDNWARADEFWPERWLGKDEEGSMPDVFGDDELGALEPFSVGPRNCLGKALAWHEIRLLLAAVLINFDLELCGESDDWAESQKVYVLWEKKPLWCKLTEVKHD